MAIDEKLRAVIAQVESSNNPFAMRFEPNVYAHVTGGGYAPSVGNCLAANKCNRATAQIAVSMSFGRYQVMGFNIYAPTSAARNQPIGALMGDAAAQDALYDAFVKAAHIDEITLEDVLGDAGKRQTFIGAYNGPGAVGEYWAMMQRAMTALKMS